jgi:hypothetical protein
MSDDAHAEAATAAIVKRTHERFARYRQRTVTETDRLLAKLLLGQWACAIALALFFSPYAWAGKTRVVHLHVWIAIFLGGAIVSLPIVLSVKRPGQLATRHVIAAGQMLLGALIIHLTGGRIETHFHIFGSLAFLAFYLEWQVLLTASAVVVLDHFLRGMIWPESIYGIVNPEWWRFLEHAFWVVFCTTFLILSCRRQLREWLAAAEEGGLMEAMAESEWQERSVLEREAKVK